MTLFDIAGRMINQIHYDPYGMPFGIPKTDFNGESVHDAADFLIWFNAYDQEETSLSPAGTPPPRWADLNLDGVVNFGDFLAFFSESDNDLELGRGQLGCSSGRVHGNIRRGCAGAELAIELTAGAPVAHTTYEAACTRPRRAGGSMQCSRQFWWRLKSA